MTEKIMQARAIIAPSRHTPGIGTQEVLAHIAGGFPGEGRHGDGHDRRVQ